MVRKLSEMNKDARSLLLYFETCAVDHGGLVDELHMNDADRLIAKQWNDTGFVKYSRIAARFIGMSKRTHAVFLSEEAWTLAHEERRNRQKRMHEARNGLTTEESQKINGDPHFSGMNHLT